QDVAVEVRLLLELLDDVPIRARVDLPVERGEVVAWQVLPVLRELHAEALERASVQAGQEPFDNGARLEVDGAEPRDDRRMQIPSLPGHFVEGRPRAAALARPAGR